MAYVGGQDLALSVAPVVEVDAWNDVSVYITCPFCEKKHIHGIDEKLEKSIPSNREPHCASSMAFGNIQYVILLPTHFHFNPITKSYESARKWKQHQGNSEVDHLDDQLRDMNISEDDDKDFMTIYSAAILNKTCTVMRIFLKDENRFNLAINNALIMVAADGNLKMTKFLIDNCDAVVDHKSTHKENGHQKRTALMEAALWGRLKVVDHLLRHGADVNLVDADGRTAYHMAKDTTRNELGRNDRVPFFVKENCISKMTRNVIHSLICARRTSGVPAERQPLVFREQNLSTGKQMQLCQSLATITDCGYKTGGVLLTKGYPRARYHPVMAISGWSDVHVRNTIKDEDRMEMIPNSKYTRRVLEFSKTYNIMLEKHEYDNEQPGRYYACHAEKQLIVYFMRTHFDLEENLKVSTPRAVTDDQQWDISIMTTNSPCQSCKKFADNVKHRFSNINIEMIYYDTT